MSQASSHIPIALNPIVNSSDVQQLKRLDPLFTGIQSNYGNPPNWERPQGFTTLAKMILAQQVSLASADAHFAKLNSYIAAFTPAEILKLTDDEMRTCQISRQKAKYLRALSDAIQTGALSLEALPQRSDAEVRKQLTHIKGIGDWTADIYLMFALQAKDVFPIGDIAVMNTIKELTHATAKEEIVVLAENWRPLRSLATYFLWHHYLKKRNRTYL